MHKQPPIGKIDTIELLISREKTVPFLYPESPEFQQIPEVFATGYMVGLMEWCCIRSLSAFLETNEGSLGTLIDITHIAPTIPGSIVKVESRIVESSANNIIWNVVARDEVDVIGRGRIGRSIVTWSRFRERLAAKQLILNGIK